MDGTLCPECTEEVYRNDTSDEEENDGEQQTIRSYGNWSSFVALVDHNLVREVDLYDTASRVAFKHE